MIGIGISLTLIYKKKTFIFASFLPRFIRCRFLQIGHIINLSTLYHGRIIRIQGKDDLIHAEYVFQRRILKEILIFRIIIRSALILLLQKGIHPSIGVHTFGNFSRILHQCTDIIADCIRNVCHLMILPLRFHAVFNI